MNRTLIKKFLYDSKSLWMCCAATLFGFCWLRVWIVSQFDMSKFKKLMEQLEHLKRFFPIPFEELLTYTGRIAVTFDEPIVVTCITIWAVSRASDCVSGEIGRGTMELLLAQPISRVRLFWTHASLTILGVALLAIAAWLGTCTGIATCHVTEKPPPATFTIPVIKLSIPNPWGSTEEIIRPMSELVSPWHFLPAVSNLFCLGFFLTGLTSLMSSWDRYRWRTIGIVVGIYLVQMIFKIVGLAVEDVGWLLHFSFFSAYEPEVFVNVALRSPELLWELRQFDEQGHYVRPGALGSHLLLLTLGAGCFLFATLIFHRRDLPAPI